MSADRVFFESLAGPLLTGMMTVVIFGVVAFPMSLLFKIGKKSISSLIRSFVLRSVLSMVFLFVIFPYGFDKVSNRVDKKYLDLLILENKNAQQVHDSIPFIADLHADTLMWKHRGSFLKSEMGHVTLSKMQKSNMALQTFAVVNSIPHTLNMQYNVNYTDIFPFLMFAQLYERESWFSPLYRARAMSRLLQSYEDEGNGVVTFIKNQQNLENFLERRKTNKNLVSGLLSVEGAQVLEYDLDNVQKLFDWGVRMFGLNHFTDNQVGGSLHGSEKYGLSEFGKKVIKKVIDLNMIIDMAHASESHMKDVLDLTESWNTTVIVSHTGVKSDCNHTRNISEEVAKRVAKRGGVMGIAFFEFTTCGAGFKSVAKTMKHLANLVGVDHIALGSDWDGAINAFGSAEHLVFLTDALISEGFNQEEINKIMGGNVLRVLRSSLPK